MATVTGTLEERCEQIWQATLAQEREEQTERKQELIIRLCDGNWALQHMVTDFYSVDFNPLDNDTGTHEIVVPFDDPLVDWVMDEQGRISRGEGQNVHVACDYVGARISGRLEKMKIQSDEDGLTKCTLTFLDEYENLKWYDIWSNPFLPALFQFPRVFILPGPAIWVLKTTLWLQTLRDNVPLLSWSLADDPMNFAGMVNLDMSTWDTVVIPTTLVDDLAAGSIWSVVISRWRNFHDATHPIMEDAEYSWYLRRYFSGDDVPEGLGFTPKHGALLVDIKDFSGTYVGTSHGGTLFDGLLRTIGDFTEDFLDTDYEAITDEEVPADYFLSGNRLQQKERPFVVYTPDMPGVQMMSHTWEPAKGVVINCGGHSMPGVNELISAGIQALFDVIGNALQIGSIGGSVDTVLKPFYEDTVLAWMSVKLYARSMKQGSSRYFEYFQQGADKAYTISSLMIMRTGIWTTRTRRSNQMEVADGGPFMIGDQGHGHFWLGHRVGGVIPGDPRKTIYMDRVRNLALHQERGQRPKFKIVIGSDDADKDPAAAAWDQIEGMLDGLQQLGVY